MKKYIIIVVLALIALSCEKEVCCVIIDTTIHLTIENSQGTDLLNPQTFNAIRSQDIKMFYEVDGDRTTYRETRGGAQLDNPEGFFVNEPDQVSFDGKYFLTLYGATNTSHVVLLEIAGRDTIRLDCEVYKTENNTHIRKVSHDGKQLWPTSNVSDPRWVKITLDE